MSEIIVTETTPPPVDVLEGATPQTVVTENGPAVVTVIDESPTQAVVTVTDPAPVVAVVDSPAQTIVVVGDSAPVEVIVVTNEGPQGPPGPNGDKNYVHNQSVSSAFWTIVHNLAKFPSVTVVDTGSTEVHGSVVHIDTNQCTVAFSVPFSGSAFCN